MKKFSLLCLLIVGLYPNITQARVCFLADQNCNASTIDTEPVSTLSCPAEYSVSPDQVCEGKIYKECRNEDLNQSLYKDLGCDKDNGYYDINDPNISFYPYVCAETTCENCCNKFKCDTEVFKNCSSPKIGDGDTCEEKDEQYYVNGNPIKFSECNCNTEIYPYNAKNCSGDDNILKGDKCVGDNGTYWTECYNNSCQYTSEYDCESQLENSDCVKDSEGCWNFAGCKQDYGYSTSGRGIEFGNKCVSCKIYTYKDMVDNFYLRTGACPTVWFKSDIYTPETDRITSRLEIVTRKVHPKVIPTQVYGENHTVYLDGHYIVMSEGTSINDLNIVFNNVGENGGRSVIFSSLDSHENLPTLTNFNAKLLSSVYKYTSTLLYGNFNMYGNNTLSLEGYTSEQAGAELIESFELNLDKDATLNFILKDYEGSKGYRVGRFSGNLEGTVNFNANNITYIPDSWGGPSDFIEAFGTVFDGDVNIDISNIKIVPHPEERNPLLKGIFSGYPTFNGKLNMIVEDLNSIMSVYLPSRPSITFNNDTIIKTKNMTDIFKNANVEFAKNLSITQDNNQIFFEDFQGKTNLVFSSEDSNLELINENPDYEYSDEDVGVRAHTSAFKGAKWSLTSPNFNKKWNCHTTYDITDQPLKYPPKEYWSEACEFSTQQECTDVDSNTVCELASDGCWKVTECDEANGWYYSDGVCKPRDCSDYQLTDCPKNTSCTSFDDKYGYNSRYNGVCISAGVSTYQLSFCGYSRQVHTDKYIPENELYCEPIKCAHFNHKKAPANANYSQCRNKNAENPYVLTACKSGYYFKDDECVKISDEICLKNHPLTACPEGANCQTCYAGSNKYYAITSCKSSTHIFNASGTACVALTGVTETDYPYAKSADCSAATPANGSCSSKTVSTSPYVYRYYFSGCKAGYHFDNGKCIINDCSDYPINSDGYYVGEKYGVGSAVCKTGSSSKNSYIMLQECREGYHYMLKGNDCVAVEKTPEFPVKYFFNISTDTWPRDLDFFEETSYQEDMGITKSVNYPGLSTGSDNYDYITGCQEGYYRKDNKCVANKCLDFPFTETPPNAKTVAICYAGTGERAIYSYVKKYRATSCEEGYRLNNHGCEPIE